MGSSLTNSVEKLVKSANVTKLPVGKTWVVVVTLVVVVVLMVADVVVSVVLDDVIASVGIVVVVPLLQL